jgi:hypothetical protein
LDVLLGRIGSATGKLILSARSVASNMPSMEISLCFTLSHEACSAASSLLICEV